MFKKSAKILIIIISLFLTFFCFNTVNAETGDKGIIIERFEYDENDELILSWSVDYGFSEWYQQYYFDINGYYIDPIDEIYITQEIQLDDVFGNYDGVWTDTDPYLKYDLIDCFEVTEYGKRQKISVQDFGTKTCSMKFTAFAYDWPFYRYKVYPANGQYIKKSDIDAVYGTDGLESMSWNLNANDIWTLAISSGGTTSTDRLTMSSIFPIEGSPSPINGVCGDLNGSTFEWVDDFNELVPYFCSSGDFYPYADNGERIVYACLGVNGGTDQYNCFADYYYNLDPTISDVIDFDFDNFTYDFEEGDTSKNWLIDVFKFLFLPREQTLQKFFTAFDNFKTKIPFGYIYLIQNQIKQVSLESTDEFALNLDLLGEDYEVFSITSLKENIGENTFNIFYNTMKALIWLMFVFYLITKSRKLFNNND